MLLVVISGLFVPVACACQAEPELPWEEIARQLLALPEDQVG